MTAGKGVVYYELLLAIMSTLVVFNFGLIFKKIRNIESLFFNNTNTKTSSSKII